MKLHPTAEEALACVVPGQRIFVHGMAATPHVLLEGLVARAEHLRDLELIHLHTHGPGAYADPAFDGVFRVANLFLGPNMRSQYDADRVDYLPCFLSEIPALLRSRRRPVHVALIHVSPPDKHGHCSLGVGVDVTRAAVDVADVVVAQVNKQMPRTHGEGFIHTDEIDHGVEVDVPIDSVSAGEPTEVELAIGRHVANLIEDGATLQTGIGRIPDAVLRALTRHRNLGAHTEMFSDGLIDLIEAGAVDNSRKHIMPGRTVASFVMGTRRLYDFIDDNTSVELRDAGFVNNVAVIKKNPRVTAINSAVEIDLTGQVCADSLGHRVISGVGGQMDFIRGASLSEDGRPIIALPSRARSESRIVPTLKPGAGVVTTRAHVHYVVTEYGSADLYGKTISERARALIAIAHPDDREDLARRWRDARGGV